MLSLSLFRITQNRTKLPISVRFFLNLRISIFIVISYLFFIYFHIFGLFLNRKGTKVAGLTIQVRTCLYLGVDFTADN